MATTKKSSPARAKKPMTKKTPAKAKAPVKKTVTKSAKKATTSSKVDYYPNRMTLAIAVLAGTLLVLLSLITVLGVQ